MKLSGPGEFWNYMVIIKSYGKTGLRGRGAGERIMGRSGDGKGIGKGRVRG